MGLFNSPYKYLQPERQFEFSQGQNSFRLLTVKLKMICVPGWREVWRVMCFAMNTTVRGAVASWLVRSTPERAVRVQALAGNIVLCSWARHCLSPPMCINGCR